jgi:hypothetical protein
LIILSALQHKIKTKKQTAGDFAGDFAATDADFLGVVTILAITGGV